MSVAPSLDLSRIRALAEAFPFSEPHEPAGLFRRVGHALMNNQVHTPHPCYFGLFNPAPTTMSFFADALVAALNPQLAAWSHSPLAVEMEMHLLRSFAAKFGLQPEQADGTFTTGGAEANQTALLAALSAAWPQVLINGLRSMRNQPVFYVSSEGHHSFLKAARICGLGECAIRYAKVGTDLRIDVQRLRQAIREDRAKGLVPFMLVGTVGSTGAGAIDPLNDLAACSREEGLWFHVDAAWGGAAVLVHELRSALDGIEQADSITFDPHKWLSVSMGAGMYLTRHPQSLAQICALTAAYMPKEAERLAICDPYSHSLQWSRRFIGLKLFLSLAAAGWNGYEQVLRHQTKMGQVLRRRLIEEGWAIVNDTPLPLVCFTNRERLRDASAHQELADRIVASGKVWISMIQLGENKTPALRACITNYRTEENHIETLVDCLAATQA
jgi:glutamate/tyrosine decarboxylase-like PLP-dependent enzyme